MAPLPSMVGSEKSFTDSKVTDRTSYSIPDDGREVTIHTERRRRKRESQDANSVLSHGTNASLLIEYFESGKAASSSGSARQPSVRVKVTPSAARRHRINQSADGGSVEISEIGGGDKNGRRPSHIHRIQLSPHSGQDRLTLGQTGRSRSYSGDHSTLSSITSGGDESNGGRAPINVTFIRERAGEGSPGSFMDADYNERRRRRRSQARNNGGDSYFDENMKGTAKQRSRSVSRESNILQEPGLRGGTLGRRKSRSLSRERIGVSQSQRERIEQAVRDELSRVNDPISARKNRNQSRTKGYDNDNLKPPRNRSRSRSPNRTAEEIAARARRKAAQIEGDNPSTLSSIRSGDPALRELIQDTIKLLLPEIEKVKQQKISELQRAESVSRSLSVKGPGRASSMPDVVAKPMVVLSPIEGSEMGMVIGGDRKESTATEDTLNHRAPGFGLPHSPLHSEYGEGVSLVGAMPTAGENHVQMPAIPFRSDTPGSYAETRASILTANTGLPYPTHSGGMPNSGMTPPPGAPKSELFPDLSELNLGGSEIGGASSLLSDRSAAGQTHLTTGTGAGAAPSIASLNLETEIDHHDEDMSAISSKDGAHTTGGPSEVSLQDISVAATSALAKERKEKGRRRRSRRDIDELSEIREGDDASQSSQVKAVNLFFAEQRERQQEQALLNPGSFQDMSLAVHHVSTATGNNLEDRRLEKEDTGHHVFDLGANPSMCSTPNLARSAVASVLDPSNVGSALSFNRPSSQPKIGASAMPSSEHPMPELGQHLLDDDDDINTNPSIIQGPIGHHTTSWEMAANDFGVGADRGLNVNMDGHSPVSNSRLASPHIGKDEGYISAANPIGSPGTATPIHGVRGDTGMGIIDDMLESEFYHSHPRNRIGSGNSHGMPTPLYDSSTGRGIDRIESKDIVALMEHLTVRDAQRNARDTEILVTLVRSAAEMRNSFEDMKKALADQRQGIVSDVDQNTERSVQKLLQGPRPLPPSTPRRPRYSKSDEDVEDEGRKRASVFKRALKGLSMGSSKDLERIEEMLCRLLGEVEGLKDGQQFYQQSQAQSQSMGTIDQMRMVRDANEAAAQAAVDAVGNQGYHSAGPSRQPSGKFQDQHQGVRISPIQEVVTLPRENRADSLPLESPTHPKMPAASASLGNTPPKSTEKPKRESGSSSLFPRLSRWSETTTSTGLAKMFKGKNNQDGSDASRSQPDFNFWETDAAKGQGVLHQSPFDSDGQRTGEIGSPLVPPSSRGTDAPINQSNRISLDIQHPRPRVTYNHQLEQQAQQLTAEGGGFLPGTPQNASVSSLGNFPPLGPGGFQNGKLLSPLAQDAYAQHQAQMNPGNAPPRPLGVAGDESHDGDSSTARRRKKHKELDENGNKIRKPKKERSEEEKLRRKEKKEQKKRSRDFLDATDGPSISGRTPSTASRLTGPRPLSSASNKENSKRRGNHISQTPNDTYVNGGEYENYGGYH